MKKGKTNKLYISSKVDRSGGWGKGNMREGIPII